MKFKNSTETMNYYRKKMKPQMKTFPKKKNTVKNYSSNYKMLREKMET